MPDSEAKRRVLTIRGRTGAVLVMNLIREENAEDVSTFFKEELHLGARSQVECVASDCPSGKLHNALASVCPAFKALYLDPVHLVIVYHTAFWHKSTPGIAALRRILAKFSLVDRNSGLVLWWEVCSAWLNTCGSKAMCVGDCVMRSGTVRKAWGV